MQYEINYFFGEEDLDQILTHILLEKIKQIYCENDENALISNCTYFSQQEGGYSV